LKTLLKNGYIVNENNISKSDLLIEKEVIIAIDKKINPDKNTKIIDAEGLYILPGLIDDQVHFREPGLTHKATIETESRAAVAGGITSFIEMPNTIPQTTNLEKLEEKFSIASKSSFANYSFMIGGTNNNLEEILKVDKKKVAGLKLFLGSSTGNMLVDDKVVLKKIFSNTDLLISVHCEDEKIIQENLQQQIKIHGQNIPIEKHPIIRSEKACYLSSSNIIQLAKETNARLHVFHLSTAKETQLFRNDIPLKDKKITAEVCVHHLSFTDADYKEKGSYIKWNPAIKTQHDQNALWKALNEDYIDVIATDHAPHTKQEKKQPYTACPSGGPLVQHGLLALLTAAKKGKITLEKIVEKTAHNPAILFQIEKRGFIKKGFFADLVLIDLNKNTKVTKDNLLYKCQWSPFEGEVFNAKINTTFVNGNIVFNNNKVFNIKAAKPLTFNR